jgi:hypothetical protein
MAINFSRFTYRYVKYKPKKCIKLFFIEQDNKFVVFELNNILIHAQKKKPLNKFDNIFSYETEKKKII